MPYKEKKCKLCGKMFRPTSGNQKYCFGCRDEYRRERNRMLRKKYYQEHKEEVKEYSRKYRQEHKEEYKKWRERYLNTIKGRYAACKAEARRQRRQLEWKLTIEEFEKIIRQPCYYCGEMDGKFSGVDRIDSNKGYTIENCVPCCKTCNRMKRTMSPQEFVKRCKKIVQYQKRLD